MTEKATAAVALQWLIQVSERDLAGVMEIETLCYGQPWTREQFREAISVPGVQARGAVDANFQLAGYLISRRLEKRTGHVAQYRWLEISNIAVHPSCWGQGIGRRLVEDRLRSASARDWDALAATISSSNVAGCDFFHAIGFRANRFRRYAHGRGGALRFVYPLTDRPVNVD